jgi:hypothetical protein
MGGPQPNSPISQACRVADLLVADKDVGRPSIELEQLMRAALDVRTLDEIVEILKKIFALLDERLPHATIPMTPEPVGKMRGGRLPLEWEKILMLTAKDLVERGKPLKAAELTERIRDACRKAGIAVPASSTLEQTSYKFMRILRGESK